MKLPSLHIKNYRNLKDLEINSLGRINLITGKNNTGKTAILEAISIYANIGDLKWLLKLLEERGEYRKHNISTIESNLKTLSSLFSDRFIDDTIMSIGIVETEPHKFHLGHNSVPKKFVSFQFIYSNPKSEEHINYSKENSKLNYNLIDYKLYFKISTFGSVQLFPLNFDLKNSSYSSHDDTFQFVRTQNIYNDLSIELWDNIALTNKESFVIDALKIIEPSVERIAFIADENSKERNAVIRLKDNDKILPLKSMGDGINKILTIILALVNADNGFLLIDEFENGLHYSVQENIWKIIFNLSEKLNIQVFATTHSEDCIAGFEKVLNQQVNPLEGKLIRLDNKNGTIREVDFSADELKIAMESNIELR